MSDVDEAHPTYVMTMPNGTRFFIGKRPDENVWFMSHITSSEPYKTVHLADFVDAKAAMASTKSAR